MKLYSFVVFAGKGSKTDVQLAEIYGERSAIAEALKIIKPITYGYKFLCLLRNTQDKSSTYIIGIHRDKKSSYYGFCILTDSYPKNYENFTHNILDDLGDVIGDSTDLSKKTNAIQIFINSKTQNNNFIRWVKLPEFIGVSSEEIYRCVYYEFNDDHIRYYAKTIIVFDRGKSWESKKQGFLPLNVINKLTYFTFKVRSGDTNVVDKLKRHKKLFFLLGLIILVLVGLLFGYKFFHTAKGDDRKQNTEVSQTVSPKTKSSVSKSNFIEPYIKDSFVYLPSVKLDSMEFYTWYVFYRSVSVYEFYISKYELTQKEYVSIMNGSNPSKIQGDSLPVTDISVKQALDFCNKLSEKYGYKGFYDLSTDTLKIKADGNGFRLPTRFEWIYAARGQKERTTKHAACDDLNKGAWYGGNSKSQPHKVGQKEPNRIGLYDMNGNVGEFVIYPNTNDTSIGTFGGDYRDNVDNWYDYAFYEGDSWNYYSKISEGKSPLHGIRLVFDPPKVNRYLSQNKCNLK